jgi:Tol biopolymer transport system component
LVSAAKQALLVANVDGTAPLALRTFKPDQGVSCPAWAPDGQRIVAAVYRESPGTPSGDRLVAFSTKDGSEQPVGSRVWAFVSSMAWLPDGSALIVAGADLGSDVSQLWLVSWPTGTVRRITNDTNQYSGISVSSDGATIATGNYRGAMSVWTASADKPEAVTRVPVDQADMLVPARGGEILFSKIERGRSSIWRMAPDGSAQQRLTPDRLDAFSPKPAALADVVVFNVLSQQSERSMWRMDLHGGDLAEIPGGANRFVDCISPDGKTVFFEKADSNGLSMVNSKLWKMPLAGGAEEVAGKSRAATPHFSPHGKLFFRYAAADQGRTAPRRIEIVAAVGEKLLRSLELPADAGDALFLRWAYSSDALTYRHKVGDSVNIWRQPIDGRAAQQITHFPATPTLYDYTWTADGSRLVFVRQEQSNSEVLLIKHFR